MYNPQLPVIVPILLFPMPWFHYGRVFQDILEVTQPAVSERARGALYTGHWGGQAPAHTIGIAYHVGSLVLLMSIQLAQRPQLWQLGLHVTCRHSN
jgi:hypothetical protein